MREELPINPASHLTELRRRHGEYGDKEIKNPEDEL